MLPGTAESCPESSWVSAILVPWRVLTGSPPIHVAALNLSFLLSEMGTAGGPVGSRESSGQACPGPEPGTCQRTLGEGLPFFVARACICQVEATAALVGTGSESRSGPGTAPGVRTKSCFLGNTNECCPGGAQGDSVKTPKPQPCTGSAPCACTGNHCDASLRPGRGGGGDLRETARVLLPVPAFGHRHSLPVGALLLRGELQAGRRG